MKETIKTWTIYRHISPSGKSYIGLTCRQPARRWNNGKGYSLQTKIGQAICKYGWENFKHEILETDILSLEEAKQREQYWISYYDSYQHGYNSTLGGDTVTFERLTNLPVYQIDKNYTIIKKFPTIAEAARAINSSPSNIAAATKANGEQITAKGFYWCLEKDYFPGWKPRKNKSNKPVICVETQEIFDNESMAAESVGKTQEAISACCYKNTTTCGGYHWAFLQDYDENWVPRENLLKDFSKIRKKIVCVETNEEFDSITAAAKQLNLCRTNINRACKYPNYTAGGFHFKYKE